MAKQAATPSLAEFAKTDKAGQARVCKICSIAQREEIDSFARTNGNRYSTIYRWLKSVGTEDISKSMLEHHLKAGHHEQAV